MIINNKPFLIGETAFHHQGDISYLRKLVEAGLGAGVDTIKVHLLFDLDDYFIEDHKAYGALAEMLISHTDFEQLHKDFSKRSVRPIYLCNDVASLRWVNSLPVDSVLAIELHASGINDVFLLEEACKFSGTVILGSGGSSIEDLYYAIAYLRDKSKNDILLMHGFQNYPTNYKEIIFSKMHKLQQIFNLPVGYADHTDPQDSMNVYISCLPQAFGFNVLEKHFTIDPNERRVDSQSAVTLDQLQQIRSMMDNLALACGTDPLSMSFAERKYGDTGPIKKAIVAKRDLTEGHLITIDDVAFKRTNGSIPVKQKELNLIIGSRVKAAIRKDTPLTFDNIQYVFREAENEQFFISKG